jgi:hypothetical protein
MLLEEQQAVLRIGDLRRLVYFDYCLLCAFLDYYYLTACSACLPACLPARLPACLPACLPA